MAECREQLTLQPARKIRGGKVASSNRTVWRISEDDIIAAARKRGGILTEEELDSVSCYVDKHFSPNGEWFDVIDMGLTSIGLRGSED